MDRCGGWCQFLLVQSLIQGHLSFHGSAWPFNLSQSFSKCTELSHAWELGVLLGLALTRWWPPHFLILKSLFKRTGKDGRGQDAVEWPVYTWSLLTWHVKHEPVNTNSEPERRHLAWLMVLVSSVHDWWLQGRDNREERREGLFTPRQWGSREWREELGKEM